MVLRAGVRKAGKQAPPRAPPRQPQPRRPAARDARARGPRGGGWFWLRARTQRNQRKIKTRHANNLIPVAVISEKCRSHTYHT